jgi:type II secretion system protein G
MRKRGSMGFTLIEMMIVIVVIAILIGVLLPSFRGTQDEAAEQRARSEIRTVATALESYYIHNSNAYPADLDDLTSASPRIISTVPDDPFNPTAGSDYTYLLSDNGVYYCVVSFGIDREQDITGVEDDGDLDGALGDDIFITNGTSVIGS